MSKISLSPSASGTGTFTIASPNSSTDRTLTLPDNTGTIITTASTFAGTGPAFSARPSETQTITSGVITKVTLDVETFDTNNNFASSRFTPTVAGYYQVNGLVSGYGSSSITNITAYIYKNGAAHIRSQIVASLTAGSATNIQISDLIYLNGSTDYIELYGAVTGTGTIVFQSTLSAFSACLVRAA